MKRFIASILLCVSLSSCSGAVMGTQDADLSAPFSAAAEITFGNDVCKAQIKRFSDDGWEFCVTEPYALEGLIVSVRGGETKLSMYGLEGSADFSDNAVSTAALIAQAMDAAKNSPASISGDGLLISGESENSHFTLSLNENGEPCVLSLEGRGITVKLSEFVKLPNDEQNSDAPFVSVE